MTRVSKVTEIYDRYLVTRGLYSITTRHPVCVTWRTKVFKSCIGRALVHASSTQTERRLEVQV